MRFNPVPDPKKNANGYVAFSSATLAAFLVAEAKRRLGIDITVDEAGYIVAGVLAIVFFGKKYLPTPRSS